MKLQHEDAQPNSTEARNLNTLYKLGQIGSTDLLDLTSEMEPTTWKAFHKMFIEQSSVQTTIGYGPFVPNPPTNPDVVMESVDYFMAVSKYLGLSYCVLTCDQAIYEICLALQKKFTKQYKNVILRMGGFHILMNFWGSIGRLMNGTGLEQLMIDGEVCQPGTAKKIMAGNDYYQMVYAHSLVETAVYARLWETFENWLVSDNSDDISDISNFASDLSSFWEMVNMRSSVSGENETRNAVMVSLDKVMKVFDRFLQQSTSPTSRLWLMYVEMMDIVRRYIYAERSGNWTLHLATVEEMLPYLVAAGHMKYTACIPQYITAMKSLPASVQLEFQMGNCTVRRKEGKFNGVWADMALEQTFNKDAKTKLFSGITKNKAAVAKYLKALPVITAISEETLKMAHMTGSVDSEESTALKKWDTLHKLRSVLEEKMINPFQESTTLINIATGQLATSDEVLQAKERGLRALSKDEKENDFKVQPVKLQLFEKSTKKPTATQKDKRTLHMEESSVSRSLCFAVNLSNEDRVAVFSREWAEYPSSLFQSDNSHPTGYSMRKGNKPHYLTSLQNATDVIGYHELPESGDCTSFCIDMMAFVKQYMDMGCKTFQELQHKYLMTLLPKRPRNCHTIHIVGDSYGTDIGSSLKFEERQRRQKDTVTKTYIPHPSLAIPKWTDFVNKHENKGNLLKFLQESWKNELHLIPNNYAVTIGGFAPGPAVMLTAEGVSEFICLTCPQHEEADTRIFEHAAYSVSNQGCTRVVIKATDTDIAVLAVYHSQLMPGLKEIWIQKSVTSQNPDIQHQCFFHATRLQTSVVIQVP